MFTCYEYTDTAHKRWSAAALENNFQKINPCAESSVSIT